MMVRLRKRRRFAFKSDYDGGMDLEVIELCNAINSLPGLRTTESCCGHSTGPFEIYFEVDGAASMEGLFFLTRAADRRYWKYGYLWEIKLSVGDTPHGHVLPTCFTLSSGPIMGEDAFAQADDLLDNMIYLLNHKEFISGFGLDLSKINHKFTYISKNGANARTLRR